MTDRCPPRLALGLLERFVPDCEPLAGDLVEEFERRPSAVWFWVQVLVAIAAEWRTRTDEIRPLRLVDLQPADALERTRRLSLRFPSVNLSASPVAGVPVGKFLTGVLCIGSGHSIGREGPSVQIGAGLASTIGQCANSSR